MLFGSLVILLVTWVLYKVDDQLVDLSLEGHIKNYEILEMEIPDSKELIQKTKEQAIWYSKKP